MEPQIPVFWAVLSFSHCRTSSVLSLGVVEGLLFVLGSQHTSIGGGKHNSPVLSFGEQHRVA